jgi:hypothetical protein
MRQCRLAPSGIKIADTEIFFRCPVRGSLNDPRAASPIDQHARSLFALFLEQIVDRSHSCQSFIACPRCTTFVAFVAVDSADRELFAMTLAGSTAHLGALSGTGSINASNDSSLDIQTATADETIPLQSSHLTIGGQGGFGVGTGPAGGMSFLASITMDESPDSGITLASTQATSMVLNETGGSLHEVFLYNGSTEVADLKISGPSALELRR